MAVVNWVHVLFTGPLLVYIGYMRPRSAWIYYFLGALGLFAAAVMSYKLMSGPWRDHKIWYVAHLLVFLPLVLYVSMFREKMNPTFFSFLLAAGMGAMGYHGVRLITKTQ